MVQEVFKRVNMFFKNQCTACLDDDFNDVNDDQGRLATLAPNQ